MSLKRTRKEIGITQEELAEKSGVDQSTISAIETGRMKHPSWDIVSKLCKALRSKPEKVFPVNQDGTAA